MSENEMKLPNRPEIEAYISEAGYICLRQDDPVGREDLVITMLPTDIPVVIRWLQTLHAQLANAEDA